MPGLIRRPRATNLPQLLEPVLAPGDRLVWTGQPTGPHRGWQDRVTAVAAAVLVASVTPFFVYAMTNMLMTGLNWALLAGLGFVVALLAIRQGSLWWRSRTVYGLTADAAVIHRLGPWGHTQVIDLKSLAHLDLEMGKGDLGTIRFGRAVGRDRSGLPPAFQDVRHARAVFDLARGAKQDPR